MTNTIVHERHVHFGNVHLNFDPRQFSPTLAKLLLIQYIIFQKCYFPLEKNARIISAEDESDNTSCKTTRTVLIPDF